MVMVSPVLDMVRSVRKDGSSAPPSAFEATAYSSLRSALRPLLTLSRVLGIAPYALTNNLRRSFRATAYSTLLLVLYVALAFGYVSICVSVRYSQYTSSFKAMSFVLLTLEVFVGLLPLVMAINSSGLGATRALLESAEKAATLLAYQPPSTCRLLVAQSCAVAALLPAYLYFAEDLYLGEASEENLPKFKLPGLQLAVVQSFRAFAFVLNACVTLHVHACLLFTACLWKRLLGDMEQKADSAVTLDEASRLLRVRLALTDLAEQFNSTFGRFIVVQVYHVTSSLVIVSFLMVFNVLNMGSVGMENALRSRGSSNFWLLSPKIFFAALCFSQLLSMSVPCMAIESSSSQIIGLARKLLSYVRAGPVAFETRWLLAEVAEHKVRLETATGSSLGARLCVDAIATTIVYVVILAQFNCALTICP